MNYIPLICALGIVTFSHAQAQDIPKSQCGAGALQLAECINASSEKADERLNSVYKLVMNMINAGAVDPSASFFYDKQKALVAAERAWIRYRNVQCTAEAAMIGQASASGTVQARGDCILKLTSERIAYLERVAASLKEDSKLCQQSAGACQLK